MKLSILKAYEIIEKNKYSEMLEMMDEDIVDEMGQDWLEESVKEWSDDEGRENDVHIELNSAVAIYLLQYAFLHYKKHGELFKYFEE